MILRGTALILICTVLAACGGEQGPEATPAAEPSGDPTDLQLSFEPDPPRSGQPVTWTLRVTNRTDAPLTVEMPSGQKGDVVLTREGQEVYRWSEGMFFTMALVTESFEPGETKSFVLDEDRLEVEPGTYELEATSTADPGPPPVRQAITVEP